MQTGCQETSSWGRWLGYLVVVGTFVAVSASFLPQQCLWVDEATQMTGLGLGPAGAARWLAGGGPSDTGQFRDRMPPLSYWVGWAWGRVFGLDEASLRWFGVTCVAIAAALVYEAARQAFGTASAWVAGLLFALSPAVIVLSVEIRAYPLFALWSALAFLALVRLRATPPEGRGTTLAALTLALALTAGVSTHFFGAVLAGSMLAALLILALRGEGRPRLVLGVGALFALTLALQWPYIVASLGRPKHGNARGAGYGARLEGVKNMLGSLIDHVTMSVHGPAAIVALIAAIVLIALALGMARGPRRPVIAVAMTLGIGVLIVTAAKLALTAFAATSSNYNIWMRPGFCIMLSAGVASRSRAARRVAGLAFGLLLVAQASGAYELAVHGAHFAHGPHRAIVDVIRPLDARDIAVVHDDPSQQMVFVYCPLRHDCGAGLGQYQLVPTADGSACAREYPAGRDWRPVTALPHRYLMVVRSEQTNPRNLAAQVRGGDRALRDGPLARALRASGDWRLVSERSAVASISAKIDLFESCRPR